MEVVNCRGRKVLCKPELSPPYSFPVVDKSGKVSFRDDAPGLLGGYELETPVVTVMGAHGYGLMRSTLPNGWQRWIAPALVRYQLSTPFERKRGWTPGSMNCWDEERSDRLVYLPRHAGLRLFGKPQYHTLSEGATISFPPYAGFENREIQETVLNHVIQSLETQLAETGVAQGLLVMYCAFGKSKIFYHLAEHFRRCTLVVVDMETNQSQQIAGMRKAFEGLRVGVLKPNSDASVFEQYDVVFGMLQSMYKRVYPPGFFDRVGLVIYDEIHAMPTNKYANVFFQVNARIMLGLTATLVRDQDYMHALLEEWFGPPLVYLPIRPEEERPLPITVHRRFLDVDEETLASAEAIGIDRYLPYMKTIWFAERRIQQLVQDLEWVANDTFLHPPETPKPPVVPTSMWERIRVRKRPLVEEPVVVAEPPPPTTPVFEDKTSWWVRAERVYGRCNRCQGAVDPKTWCFHRLCGHLCCEDSCDPTPNLKCPTCAIDILPTHIDPPIRLRNTPVIYEGHRRAFLLSDSVEYLRLIRSRVEAQPWAPLCGTLTGGATTEAARCANDLAMRQQWVFATFQKASKAIDLSGCTRVIDLTTRKDYNTVAQSAGRNQRAFYVSEGEAASPRVIEYVDREPVSLRMAKVRNKHYTTLRYVLRLEDARGLPTVEEEKDDHDDL